MPRASHLTLRDRSRPHEYGDAALDATRRLAAAGPKNPAGDREGAGRGAGGSPAAWPCRRSPGAATGAVQSLCHLGVAERSLTELMLVEILVPRRAPTWRQVLLAVLPAVVASALAALLPRRARA